MAPFTFALLLASAIATNAYDELHHHDAVVLLQGQVETIKGKPAEVISPEADSEYMLADPTRCSRADSAEGKSFTEPALFATTPDLSVTLRSPSQKLQQDPAGAGTVRVLLHLGTIVLLLDCVRRWYLQMQHVSKKDREVGVDMSAWATAVNAITRGDVHIYRNAVADESLLTHADAWGCTALHFAAASGSTAITADILKRGVNPDALDAIEETPLHIAARAGHVSICEVLLGAGANVNAVNKEGMTPLVAAGHAGHMQTCRLLADRGAGVAGLADEELPQLIVSQLVRKVLEADM